MSCDEITINSQVNEIKIINNEDRFNVVDHDNVTVIVDNEDSFEVKDDVTKLTINVADIRLIPSQNSDIAMICSSVEQAGDVVYSFGSNEVRRADNSDISTAKVVGFIVSKSNDTSCLVRISGIINLGSLTVGGQYFLGNNGAIVLTPPTDAGSVIVRVGQSLSISDFLININNNYTIRS